MPDWRPSFDAMLAQIRELLPEVPLLRERLWKPVTKSLPTFSLRCDFPSYGRGFDLKKFMEYLPSLFGDLKGSKVSAELIRSKVSEIDKGVQRFEYELQTGKASESRGEFYSRLRAKPEVQQTLYLILKTSLTGSSMRTVFERGHPDEVLDHFVQLRNNPTALLGDCGVVFFDRGFWTSLIRPALPTLSQLLRMLDVFPIQTRSTRSGKQMNRENFRSREYHFKPVTRGLHSIWRGIPFNDCVGGNRDYLDQLMPTRWACSALEEVIYHDVIFEGKIVGYCMLVPFEHGGARYASIDTQWPPLFNLTSKRELLFLRWLKEVRRVFPKNWNGAVVGSHPAGRQPFETEALQNLDCYKKGRTLGSPSSVTFRDDLALQLAAVSEKRGHGSLFRANYGSQMLTDASFVGEELPLVVLNLD
jgi:hypothetical protein